MGIEPTTSEYKSEALPLRQSYGEVRPHLRRRAVSVVPFPFEKQNATHQLPFPSVEVLATMFWGEDLILLPNIAALPFHPHDRTVLLLLPGPALQVWNGWDYGTTRLFQRLPLGRRLIPQPLRHHGQSTQVTPYATAFAAPVELAWVDSLSRAGSRRKDTPFAAVASDYPHRPQTAYHPVVK